MILGLISGMDKIASNAWERVIKRLIQQGETGKAMSLMRQMTEALPSMVRRPNIPDMYISQPFVAGNTSVLRRLYHGTANQEVTPLLYSRVLKGAMREWRDAAMKFSPKDIRAARIETAIGKRRPLNAIPWASPEQEVNIQHGGGKRYLEQFLAGKHEGYSLNQQQPRSGLQVIPSPTTSSINPENSIGYANRIAGSYFDLPAMLTGKIKAKYLSYARGHEAGLPYWNVKHLRDAKLVPVKQGPINYKVLSEYELKRSRMAPEVRELYKALLSSGVV